MVSVLDLHSKQWTNKCWMDKKRNSGDDVTLSRVIDSKEVFFYQLLEIPGINDRIAHAIQQHYPTLAALLSKYNELNDETERQTMLKGIKVTQTRNIGEILSARLWVHFFNV